MSKRYERQRFCASVPDLSLTTTARVVFLATRTVLMVAQIADTDGMWRPRVLVVDDELSIRVFAEKALTAAGYEPLTAGDGPEALRLIDADGAFDLFIVDVTMPQMLGTDLGRQIRRNNPKAKILYFTGYADRLFEEKGLLWQDEAFIEKPVQTSGFLEAVSLLLFGHVKGPQPTAA